jgi:integrase/recombinase XerD
MQSVISYHEVRLMQETGETLFIHIPYDADFIKLWLHGKSYNTQTAYLLDIQRLYDLTGKSLRELTLDDFQGFADNLYHLKRSSRARIMASVKSALSFGLKIGYLQVNVGSAVELPKLENKLAERILSEQQIAKMFALEDNPRNHAILILLYRAGLRVSELCDLTWRNLQERDEAGQIAVFGKGKKTRHVLLDPSTWQEVTSLKIEKAGPDDYVFQSRKGKSRLDESTIHRIVASASKRAGITGKVSPHWMRHAHATHALERGAPITLVQATLGHESMETTAKYTHVRPNASSSQFLGI